MVGHLPPQGSSYASDVMDFVWSTRQYASELGVADLVQSPSARGHAEEHLSRALGLDKFLEEDVVYEKVPLIVDGKRELVDHPILLISESIHRTARTDKDSLLTKDPDILGLPRFERIILASGVGADSLVLVRIYVDGIRYGSPMKANPESVLAFFWCPVHEAKDFGKRRVISVLRKADLCNCGCSGRCSVDVIFTVIADDLINLGRGIWGASKSTGGPLDATRAARAGTEMLLRAALGEVGADMAEYTHSFGFRARCPN